MKPDYNITISDSYEYSDLINANDMILNGSMNDTNGIISNMGTITIGNFNAASDYIANTPYYDSSLKVTGDAVIDGALKVNGVDISETLQKINERLALLNPNPDLESKWERLKSLGNQYRELEKEILEQENIYKILKK